MTYYISPRFLDKVAVHITKNYLNLPGIRVPLILGIHGRKGEGKTFQCELVFERMGIEVVHVSGGELESPDAGDPARLIRLRYREAAELSRVRGTMTVLMINDLDAGAGRFDAGTQYTVNTQLVNSTLMNIADNPTDVQLPGSYDDKPLQRTPILATGNDFATLYAPLIRDGRMEKFFWEPDRRDRIGIVGGIFAPDGLTPREVEHLIDTFPDQAIDFYSALRARIYDEQIREFIHTIGLEKVSKRIVNSTEAAPQFPKPNFSLEHLIEQGQLMVAEQRRIQEMRLVRDYNQVLQQPEQHAPYFSNPEPTPSNRRSDDGKGNGRSPSSSFAPSPLSSAPPSSTTLSTSPTLLSPEVTAQVRQLLRQGYRIGLEHVNERRFRTNSWQTCACIEGENEYDTIAHLEACLNQFPRDYVRLIGIDPDAKRRVVETIIQRPSRS